MEFKPATEQHIQTLMTWFSNEDELKIWSGPNFRFPFNLETFKQDLKLASIASFVLESKTGELLAFGQFYLRLGKCHLGRLIVNPAHRGKGLIATLINQLCIQGNSELQSAGYSLFVMANNNSAVQAYEKLGFNFEPYPDEIGLENCLYMVKLASQSDGK